MRAGWAGTALFFFLLNIRDTAFYYSDEGLLPTQLGKQFIFRGDYRFSVLDFASPETAWFWSAVLVFTLTLSLLGLVPRLSTIISAALLICFHERNLLPLAGGDTVLRVTGVLLAISPGIGAFGLSRLPLQWQHWQRTRELLPAPNAPIWPWRLNLWQLCVIYLTSVWDKMLGTMWWDGTAPVSAWHHVHFNRLPLWFMDMMSPYSPLLANGTLIFEWTWALLLIPASLWARIGMNYHRLKRWILLGGLAFHGGILLFMTVGSFPIAMVVTYLGLLTAEDFAAWRRFFNGKRWAHKHLTVLYDGHCPLCRRSAFSLGMCDWLHRVKFANYHERETREHFPQFALADLNKAMHVVLPNGKTAVGYDGFAALTRHLPALWLAAPFLTLPGISHVGRLVYARIAKSRHNCTDETCSHR